MTSELRELETNTWDIKEGVSTISANVRNSYEGLVSIYTSIVILGSMQALLLSLILWRVW